MEDTALICDGELDVREAQKEIAEDWTETYSRLIHERGDK